MRNLPSLQSLHENVYRRLLEESTIEAIEGLAAHIYPARHGIGMSAVLYKPNVLIATLKNSSQGRSSNVPISRACREAIVGEITISEPEEACAGAWEVSSIAGEGYGKILYGLGYAMAPSGLLMSDRLTVSQKAHRAWAKQMGKRKSIELDDASAPKNKRKTPDDPTDDCALHGGPHDDDCDTRDPSPLNNAYEAQGWEEGMTLTLKKAHKEALKQISSLKISIPDIEKGLSAASFEFFRTQYDAEVKAGRA